MVKTVKHWSETFKGRLSLKKSTQGSILGLALCGLHAIPEMETSWSEINKHSKDQSKIVNWSLVDDNL